MNKIKLENFIYLNDEDLLEILSWRNRDEIRLKMSTSEIISKESHLSFCHNLKNRNDCVYFRVSCNEKPCGVFSLQKIDKEKHSAEPGSYYVWGPKLLPYWVSKISVYMYQTLGIKEIHFCTKKDNEQAILFNILKNKAKVILEDDQYVYFSQSIEYLLNNTNNDTSELSYEIKW